jgi:hypothetical protein
MPRDANDPEFISMMEEIEQRAKPIHPRAYTCREIADQLVSKFASIAEYWSKHPSGGTIDERCHGVAFSILAALDGTGMDLPGFDLIPTPHEGDKDWYINRGENYYDPETRVSYSLHDFYHGIKRDLYPDPEPQGRSMNTEKERAIVLHAAVGIANEEGYSGTNKLDACHNVAKKILGMFDGEVPGIPAMMVFPAPTSEFQTNQVAAGNDKWDHIIPLNRRMTSYGVPEDERLASDYDIIRMRSAAAAQAMFGVPEAA